jgi:hypothetical protein
MYDKNVKVSGDDYGVSNSVHRGEIIELRVWAVTIHAGFS